MKSYPTEMEKVKPRSGIRGKHILETFVQFLKNEIKDFFFYSVIKSKLDRLNYYHFSKQWRMVVCTLESTGTGATKAKYQICPHLQKASGG